MASMLNGLHPSMLMTKVASSSQRISLVGDTEEEGGWDSVMAIEDGDLGEGQSSVEGVDVMRIPETP